MNASEIWYTYSTQVTIIRKHILIIFAYLNLRVSKSVKVNFVRCSLATPHLHSKWSILCIDHIRHLVCIECVIFWYPIHTCYVWDQAVQQDFFMRWDWCILYWNIFLNFNCTVYTTKYSNLLLIILILVWIVCSTYRKGEILMQKWHVTSQFVYCYMPY